MASSNGRTTTNLATDGDTATRKDGELGQKINAVVERWYNARPDALFPPFHLAVLTLINDSSEPLLGPTLSTDSVALADRLIRQDEGFASTEKSQKTLAAINERWRRELLSQRDSTSVPLGVTVCKRKQFNPDGTIKTGTCCTKQELAVGCDAGAGTAYLAKTNGRVVVFAGFLQDEVQRKERRRFANYESPSLLLFTALHEFGHVLYLNSRTRADFDDVQQFYSRVAASLDPKLRNRAGVVVSDDDFNEFQASNFAIATLRNYENARADKN